MGALYYVQGLWPDGRICAGCEGIWGSKRGAIRAARAMRDSAMFEGSHVRVICEGELVWGPSKVPGKKG